MNTTDPIADMLTRIRNASNSKHKTVDVPASKVKRAIAEILFEEGYIGIFWRYKRWYTRYYKNYIKYDENGTKCIFWIKKNK